MDRESGVAIVFIEPQDYSNVWPFKSHMMVIACKKEKQFRSLSWESPDDGTGDWSSIALIDEPPYVGNPIQRGRSMFSEISIGAVSGEAVQSFLIEARAVANSLCSKLN